MTIVVGHLTTPEGQAALAAAVDEAQQRGLPLVVVASGSGDESGEADLADLRERAEARGVALRVEQGGDDRADDLVRLATETSAELLVIGLRRRSPVGKLILGAGAQRILIESPCPVLTVKV